MRGWLSSLVLVFGMRGWLSSLVLVFGMRGWLSSLRNKQKVSGAQGPGHLLFMAFGVGLNYGDAERSPVLRGRLEGCWESA
uniref:Putative secreted peptide n=1 Tax=Anopheles braziliensis TaxID=58242 RepID=A0A2M3ZWM4_9DIPT